MNSNRLARLVDLAPRLAWQNEERDFTPWLSENLAAMGDAIGIPLEFVAREVLVDRFEADILARNPINDTVVLIENQLEATDHTHLGQILTYLAGLDAHTVVWIAPVFREPHLSAVRWLNEHTSEGFSFFAVKVRIVQIADSPLAPVFEVLEQPNGWERQLVAARSKASGSSETGERRRAFWQAYLDQVPDAAHWGLKPTGQSSIWVPVPDLGVEAFISMWVGKNDAGAFLRGAAGSDIGELVAQLAPNAASLEKQLEATFDGKAGNLLWRRAGSGLDEEASWPNLIEWMERTRIRYLAAMAQLVDRG